MRTLALVVLLVSAAGAAAQGRTLPADSQRGTIRHVVGHLVEVDGKTIPLAPGATIRDEDNLIRVPTALPMAGAVAQYVLGADGLIARVWLLTPDEAARGR